MMRKSEWSGRMIDTTNRSAQPGGGRRSSHSLRRAGCSRRLAPLRGEAAQSLVELALVTPVFCLLLLVAAEFGRLAYAGIEVNSAARAGVAYGAQSPSAASDSAGITTAALNDAADVNDLNVSSSSFCSCSSSSSTAVTCNDAATTCAGSHVLTYVKVNTSAAVKPMIRYPGIPQSFTLSGQAIMRVGQQ